MNRDDVELARAGLEIYAQQLSPDYQMLRDGLLGRLAANGVMADEMRYEHQNALHNADLIQRFAGELPVTVHAKPEFHIPDGDVYTARLLDSSLFWLVVEGNNYFQSFKPYYDGSDDGGLEYSYRVPAPFYILGQRIAPDNRKQSQLLLFPATPEKAGAQVVTVRQKDVENRQSELAQAVGTRYNREELASMLNRANGYLEMRPSNTQALCQKKHIAGRIARRSMREVGHNIPPDAIKVIENEYLPPEALTDGLLANFDVFSYLNRLSTAFDKVAELSALLERRAQVAEEHPTDLLLSQ